MVEINTDKGLTIVPISCTNVQNNSIFMDCVDNQVKVKDNLGNVSTMKSEINTQLNNLIQTTKIQAQLSMTPTVYDYAIVDSFNNGSLLGFVDIANNCCVVARGCCSCCYHCPSPTMIKCNYLCFVDGCTIGYTGCADLQFPCYCGLSYVDYTLCVSGCEGTSPSITDSTPKSYDTMCYYKVIRRYDFTPAWITKVETTKYGYCYNYDLVWVYDYTNSKWVFLGNLPSSHNACNVCAFCLGIPICACAYMMTGGGSTFGNTSCYCSSRIWKACFNQCGYIQTCQKTTSNNLTGVFVIKEGSVLTYTCSVYSISSSGGTCYEKINQNFNCYVSLCGNCNNLKMRIYLCSVCSCITPVISSYGTYMYIGQ